MQGSKLYVGNLDYRVTSDQLVNLFSQYGEVKSANVVEGRGFGFVEMSQAEEAERARDELNGTEFEGRTLRIDAARPPQNRSQRGPRDRGRYSR
ncbi:MAG: RNA-binding protein [Candidatus Zixiibacteriota bacterium]